MRKKSWSRCTSRTRCWDIVRVTNSPKPFSHWISRILRTGTYAVRKRMDKKDDIFLFLGCQMQGAGRKRLIRYGKTQPHAAAFVVELDNSIQRLERAVVHIGIGELGI